MKSAVGRCLVDVMNFINFPAHSVEAVFICLFVDGSENRLHAARRDDPLSRRVRYRVAFRSSCTAPTSYATLVGPGTAAAALPLVNDALARLTVSVVLPAVLCLLEVSDLVRDTAQLQPSGVSQNVVIKYNWATVTTLCKWTFQPPQRP